MSPNNSDGNLFAFGVVSQILETETCVGDEFTECFELTLFPARVVEIFIEHDHCSSLDARRQELKNCARGRIEITVDVNKGGISWIFFEETRKGFVEPTLYQDYIVPHLGERLHFEVPRATAVSPSLRQSLERIKSVYGLIHLLGHMVDGTAGKDPELQEQAIAVFDLSERQREQLQLVINRIHLQQLISKSIHCLRPRPQLHFCLEIGTIDIPALLQFKPDRPTNGGQTFDNDFPEHCGQRKLFVQQVEIGIGRRF